MTIFTNSQTAMGAVMGIRKEKDGFCTTRGKLAFTQAMYVLDWHGYQHILLRRGERTDDLPRNGYRYISIYLFNPIISHGSQTFIH